MSLLLLHAPPNDNDQSSSRKTRPRIHDHLLKPTARNMKANVQRRVLVAGNMLLECGRDWRRQDIAEPASQEQPAEERC